MYQRIYYYTCADTVFLRKKFDKKLFSSALGVSGNYFCRSPLDQLKVIKSDR